MTNRFKPTEMKELVDKSLKKDKDFVNSPEIAKSENPQVVEMRNRARGRIEAWEDILDYYKGHSSGLRISAGEW